MVHARRFHALGVWRHVPLDDEAVRGFLGALDARDDAYLGLAETGLVCGVLVPLWFAPGHTVAAELIWHAMKPGEGKALREGFEAWAREKGAAYVQFSAMADEHEPALRRLMARGGFEPVEIGFRKGL